ncbi:hypothetical protein FSP39_022861 [Pinctada imbricata]|uniref:Apextrin C-terminal domain-containing protein n=1 Tax=Pinctada imbricata TaxID=66713 RepID=A0AA88XSN1_PINIB|nr:hypothetical protein FSP39_022861 [Pinctada imbricata]
MIGVLVVTSLSWTLVGGAIHQKDVNHWIISPKDNCKPVCPCIMDGINYEHGERWQKKDQPCSTYECTNGYYEAVYRGCEYKGKCKDSGTTWTEGCFTYKCFTSDIWAYYRLIQGGCEDSQGNCWKVGDTFRRDCHTFECQIVGSGCYKLITKTAEVMYWPEGDYALMKPKFGCPRDKSTEWSEGNRYHCGNAKNDISNPFDLYGNYSSLCFDQFFCVHQEIKDLSYIPRYQTFWEAGCYCILRKGGKCPKGFSDGYVGMDDLLGLEMFSSSNGSLPDGNYTKDTGLNFCCRNDSYAKAPIVLPKDDAFVLFMVNGSNECQTVRGMTSEVQYFAFDDDDHFTKTFQNGSLPLIMRDDGITVFYYCIYKPLDCGCKIDNGEFLKVGDTIVKDCSEYKCVESNGMRYLKVLKGGCLLPDDSCKNENHTWTETSGETCHVRVCIRDMESDDITFKIITDFVGCRDDDKCISVGSSKKRGCYDLRCVFPFRGANPRFRMLKAGCSDGKGGCIPLGKTFQRGCVTYRCRKEPTKCELEFIKGGCSYYGKCYKEGDNATDGCFTRQCTLNVEKNYAYMEIVNGGCPHQGKCIPVNSTFEKECNTFRCFWKRQKREHKFGIEVANYGCKYGGKCYEIGDVIDKNCINYICSLSYLNGHRYAKMQPSSKACQDGKGGCIQLGTELQDDNCFHKKCTDNGHWPVMKIVRGGCSDPGPPKTCRSPNETWTDGCYEKRCLITKDQNKMFKRVETKPIGCMNNGVCREIGYTMNYHGCHQYKCIYDERIKQARFSFHSGEGATEGAIFGGSTESITDENLISESRVWCMEIGLGLSSRRKSESEGIQNQDKTGTKANKQKPPPYEKKRTPDMGVRPGAQEE